MASSTKCRALSPKDLAALDRYEDFYPGEPERSEFVRQKILVETASHRLAAIAYVLREGPLTDVVTVEAGSFSRFIGQRGLRPYGAGAMSASDRRRGASMPPTDR